MAAKKDTAPKTAAPAADKKAALETALAQIEKQFGKGAVMKLGANVTMQVDAIPTPVSRPWRFVRLSSVPVPSTRLSSTPLRPWCPALKSRVRWATATLACRPV